MPFNPEKEEDFLLNEYFIQWTIHPNEESNRFWAKWMAEHPDKSAALKRAKETILSFKTMEYSMDESANERILNNILIRHQRQSSGNQQFKAGFFSRLPKLSIAASFLLICFASASLFYFLSPQHKPESATDPEWITKTTKTGSKLTFTLPDGSLVKLNANSSIEFPQQFSDSIREVRINGQAFFEIKHQDSLPFIVRATDLKVEVLGTSFDVRSYPDESDLVVALLTGKVSISTNVGINEVLHPMEMISYSRENKEMVKEIFDPEQAMGWKDGIIRFKNTAFPEVFRILERWYGVEISTKREFKGGFNGRFDNESLENVLTGMSFSENFQFKINNNKVMIF